MLIIRDKTDKVDFSRGYIYALLGQIQLNNNKI